MRAIHITPHTTKLSLHTPTGPPSTCTLQPIPGTLPPPPPPPPVSLMRIRESVPREGKSTFFLLQRQVPRVCSACACSAAQLCLSLCDPVHCSPPGSSVHGILQAGILEWVAIPSPGDLRNPGINPGSPALQADSLLSEPPEKPRVGPFSNAIVYTHSTSDPYHPHHCLPHLHLCHLSTSQFLRPCHWFCILIAKIMIKARLYRGLILEEN